MPEAIMLISSWCIPVIIIFILTFALLKKVKIYEQFTEGASQGIKTAIKIFPYLLAMLVAINIFRESGALDLMVRLIKPFTEKLNIPGEVLPLLFLRPLSGSGSLSYTAYLLKEYGADSYIGKLASTIQGSTETTFYIVAVYFGSIGIKKYRYAVTVGILADLAGFFAAAFICKLLFL